MFFLVIAILETFATAILGIAAASSDTFYIGGVVFLSLVINCIFWFSLYSMWSKTKKNEEYIKALKESLNECRDKLNLPVFKEEKKEDLPTYNPYFNFYVKEGVDDEDDDDNLFSQDNQNSSTDKENV